MRSQSIGTSEQYWRDRYGLPPRSNDRVSARSAPRRWRLSPRKAAPAQGGARRLLDAVASKRGFVLKLGIAAFTAIWLAVGGLFIIRLELNPEGGGGTAQSDVDSDQQGGLARLFVSRSHDALLSDNGAANEAALIALRGYILTGSEGFKSEWQRNVTLFEASQSAIVKNSRGWTDGRQLLQLTDFRRTSEELLSEERVVADIVGTPNRFPGLRLYDEEVAPAFDEALRLCDLMLQSIMTSNWPDSSSSVDALARLRGDLRTMRAGLALYLHSRSTAMPVEVEAAYESFQGADGVLSALRVKARPGDQAKYDRMSALIQSTDKQLQQILALKRTARWDYADYAFRQKIMPLSEKISMTLGDWRNGG